MMVLLCCAVLAVLFYGCFLPGYTLFSNDGPLGAQMAACNRVPAAFTGSWQDLNSIGFRAGGAWPSVTYGLLLLLGPIGYAKFYAFFGLLILGCGAWCFFRQLGLNIWACVLGGLAAMLNSGYFSTACWGVVAHPIAVGMSFFAMAALVDSTSNRRWLRVALAGVAVGVAVADGADMGAIFSMYVALFVMYQAFIAPGERVKTLATGVTRVALVAVFAAFFAAQTISVLVGTQIKGVAGTSQDTQSKQEHWDWATQWSFPKRETLGILIPGLFGYRMDAEQKLPEYLQEHYVGANYWGAAGRDPRWDRYYASGEKGPAPAGAIMRFSGGGEYAGVLVVLVGLWAAVQAFRKRDPAFTLDQRKQMWFWVGTGFVALLLAFGRFAPFYRLLYALPYFSTIRNPAKFLHVFSFALVVLFAYGIDALIRRNLAAVATGVSKGFKGWWARAAKFDKGWLAGCGVAFAVCVIGWVVYAGHRTDLENYLQSVQFPASVAPDIARFSIGQVGWFILFLAGAILLFAAALSGRFAGPKARWAGILLGLFLVVDLGRANLPWIIFVDYQAENATNPVIDLMREQPYEHRVAILPFPGPPQLTGLLDELYSIQWAQNQFQFYNIQSLDVVQMSRAPEDLVAFEGALRFNQTTNTIFRIARRWQLTNTKYLLGPAGYLDQMNRQLDPEHHSFRILARFNIGLKPGVTEFHQKLEELTAALTPDGPYALFEYGGALPRAKIYTHWQVSTNDTATLKELGSQSFDPERTVLVDTPLSPSSNQMTSSGSVEFVSYAPKDIVFHAEASAPAVLLLNDRFDPNWRVFVDGQRQPLLRCNYIMRGVQLAPGQHRVEFRFKPPVGALYVSIAGALLGVALVGMLVFGKRTEQAEPPRGQEQKSSAGQKPEKEKVGGR